jgi:hypothetical protein
MIRTLVVLACLLVATTLEANGDAMIRIGLLERSGTGRLIPIIVGAVLLLGYGVMLNLAPLPFERVVGLYIGTLFVIWQLTSFLTFRTVPSLPILVGGGLIVVGGLLVTFWTTSTPQ